MSIRTPLATLCLTLAVAGSLSAQKVSTDWDHSANWSKYNSYYIQIQKAFGDQLGQQRAIAAVDSALKSRGWKKMPPLDAASAAVLVSGAGQKEETSTTMYTRRRVRRVGLGRRRHGHGHDLDLARMSSVRSSWTSSTS